MSKVLTDLFFNFFLLSRPRDGVDDKGDLFLGFKASGAGQKDENDLKNPFHNGADYRRRSKTKQG